MPRDRRRVYFSGRVQGVGFRFTCQSLARRFDIAGYVRNLSDGRVELVAEGESGELDAFLTAIRTEMDRFIKDVTKPSSSRLTTTRLLDFRFVTDLAPSRRPARTGTGLETYALHSVSVLRSFAILLE